MNAVAYGLPLNEFKLAHEEMFTLGEPYARRSD